MAAVHTHAWHSRDGAVTSEQRVCVRRRPVRATRSGALRLADAYWAEVERFTRGIVRARRRADGVELRLAPAGPVLLRLGHPDVTVAAALVACSYPIEGGLLARRPAGTLTLAQTTRERVELRSSVAGFLPRLDAAPGAPAWRGALYARVQARIHEAVGRRFLFRLTGEGGS